VCFSLTRSLLLVLRPVTHHKPTPYFYGYRTALHKSSLDVVLCLPFHIYDGVDNVLKHILFNVLDVKVMAEKIGLSIRKLPKNTSLHPVMSQTKTRKLMLTWLETKQNVTILWHNIKQFFTEKARGCNIFFNSTNKEILSVLYVPVIRWQEMTVTIKKEDLPPFVSVNALLFSIQYGYTRFPCVLQPETII